MLFLHALFASYEAQSDNFHHALNWVKTSAMFSFGDISISANPILAVYFIELKPSVHFIGGVGSGFSVSYSSYA